MNTDQPLSVGIEDGVLTIKIGIGTLAWAAEHSNEWNPFDDTKNDYVQAWEVTDQLEFAKDTLREMMDEREDGSTPLTDFLDKMQNAAAFQGSLGIDECTTGISRWARDYKEKEGHD